VESGKEFRGENVPAIISEGSTPSGNVLDEERGLGPESDNFRNSVRRHFDETEMHTRGIPSPVPSNNHQTSNKIDAVSSRTTPATLLALVQAYLESEVAAEIRNEMRDTVNAQRRGEVNAALPDMAIESILLPGRKRANWGTQFRILSGRAFKNLYRDPALLAAHYLSSIALACESSLLFSEQAVDIALVICGLFYHHVT
jgi:hypothetical protein